MSKVSSYTDKDGEYIFYHKLKLLLVGDTDAGKTQLLHSKLHGFVVPPIPSTIGVDFNLQQHESPKANLIIWDTSGQTRFRNIIISYYRGSIGFIVVFDLTNDSSLTSVLETWLPLIKEHAGDLYQVTVVGMKCDLKKQRQVSRERAMILMDELELKYYEASGVTGHNVEHIFTDLVERIIDMIEREAKKEIRK